MISQRAKGGLTPSGRSIVVTGAGGSLTTRVATYLKPGATITLRPTMTGLPAGLTHALGGGPLLVDGGNAVHDSGEGFTFGQVAVRSARTAVGQTSDGQTLLVVTEGPLEGSRGQTVNQQADQLAALGAQVAVAMDSGGSSSMAIGRRLINRPAAGERALANALIIRYAGVQLSDPTSVITPNGDGSRDAARTFAWAAKPGRATITRPVPTEAASQPSIGHRRADPTLHPHRRPQRRRPRRHLTHRCQVHSDRQHARLQQKPPIVIDRTLGHLTVRKSKAAPKRLHIGFTLTHAATVTATISNRSGRRVYTLMRRVQLPSGTRQVISDMKVRGKRLPRGVYTLSISSRKDRADLLSRVVSPDALISRTSCLKIALQFF